MYKLSLQNSARIILTAATLAAPAGSATAADLGTSSLYKPPPPPPPMFSWTGCYVGANVGGGSAAKSANDAAGAVTGVSGADLGSHTASGVIGGGQVGCDYQAGAWVFGVQGMFGRSGIEGSNTDPSGLFAINSRIRSFATVTGRLGYAAAPTMLVYAKGGGAWVRDNYTLTDVTGTTLTAASTNPSGWTIGGGIEWAVAGNWTAFAEYNYLDFGTRGVSFTSNTSGLTFPINIKQNINSFSFGINYRFGPRKY
jgi:outer membrane immunogenic protein